MTVLIYILLLIFGVYFYYKKKYSNFICSLFFILFSGFYFLPEPDGLKLNDLALVLVFICSFIGFSRHSFFFKPVGDSVAIIIYLLLGYYFLMFISTIFLSKETVSFALKVFRLEFYLLSYFLFRSIPIKSVILSIKYLMYFTVLGGLFYSLQYVGITDVLINKISIEGTLNGENLARFRNYPILTVPIIFYLLFTKYPFKYKYIYIFILFLVVILAQGRGELIAMVSAFLVLNLLNRNFSRIIKFSVIISLIILVFSPFLIERFSFEKGGSFKQELETGLSFLGNKKYSKEDIGDTFTFRMFLANERIMYLFENPVLLPFGVGLIHEDSPNNKFKFIVGSTKINEKGVQVQQEIETDDIAFVTKLFRYGIVYLFLYIIFLTTSLRFFYKNRFNILGIIGFLLLTKIIIQSLGSDQFSTFKVMAFLLLLLSQMYKLNKLTSSKLT